MLMARTQFGEWVWLFSLERLASTTAAASIAVIVEAVGSSAGCDVSLSAAGGVAEVFGVVRRRGGL